MPEIKRVTDGHWRVGDWTVKQIAGGFYAFSPDYGFGASGVELGPFVSLIGARRRIQSLSEARSATFEAGCAGDCRGAYDRSRDPGRVKGGEGGSGDRLRVAAASVPRETLPGPFREDGR